jgi:sugar lactone lactonase YvrE
MERRLELLSTPEPLANVSAQPHGLLEAPRPDGAGGILYSDVLVGGVYRAADDGSGEPQAVLPKRRGIGGLIPHRDGGIVVTGRSVVHVDGERQRELLTLEGATGFNDLATDVAGNLLVGALRFRPFAGEDPAPTEVWRVSGPGRAEVVAEGIDWPNGIGLSPGGESIYVSDTAHGVIRVYGDGDTSGATFAAVSRGAVDGLAVDEDGGLWVALGDGGIARFAADGSLTGVAEVAAGFVSSLCFGGTDRRDVYITTADDRAQPETGGTIFRARSEVAGLEVPSATV